MLKNYMRLTQKEQKMQDFKRQHPYNLWDYFKMRYNKIQEYLNGVSGAYEWFAEPFDAKRNLEPFATDGDYWDLLQQEQEKLDI